MGRVLHLVLAAATMLAVTDGGPEEADQSGGAGSGGLVRTDFRVRGDEGVSLAVREVRAGGGRAAKRPVLLLHGARVPGVASFDLPVPGGSLAADLARAGHRVFVMDARGYGGSTRPAAMSRPPSAGPPAVRSDEVVRDVAAVVEEVSRRTRAAHPDGKVALLGWATGGHWLGQYAATYTNRVSHLVLYNTLYGPVTGHPTMGPGSDFEDPERPGRFNAARFGAYRLSTGAGLSPSWDDSIPVPDKSVWRDPAVVDAYVRAALASDPTSGSRTPPSFRAPSGALEDSFHLATGRQLWDAGLITAPTLVVRSERDFWSRAQDVAMLERHLTRAAAVRSVELADATHYVHLDRAERGRDRFVAEVLGFLGASR
ncbi:alpha/beta hydrolase [Microtetraspora sp. NBRC 13810]|uniref:alpha/beta fold hydrolase n=1 Tax=Microtetraspora sp. NBRC 13810 TaxID=3030990 RepID=UPI0024A5EB15|nr:alpha/beta fold hydrolase [Microtetraspora sp. NBRC 13810]GLW07646.1 alpha/beta hydrolase [Microtetraspora sp. NBRC 13810]